MATLKRVLDASVLVKALVPPRRKKADEILREQQRLHRLARGELKRVESKDVDMLVPTIALIEVGAVVRRLTGSTRKAHLAIEYVRTHSRSILTNEELLDAAIELAVDTGCRAVDGLYLAAARRTDAELFTDDRRMHGLALQEGIPSLLLRESQSTVTD